MILQKNIPLFLRYLHVNEHHLKNKRYQLFLRKVSSTKRPSNNLRSMEWYYM